jgi:hypothetical protein
MDNGDEGHRTGEAASSTHQARLDEERYNLQALREGHLTKEQLLAIDLTKYDRLATCPPYWPLERQRILFLQAALRLGTPFDLLVRLTQPHFGPVLKSGFDPVVTVVEVEPFQPPPFDLARQTPEQWSVAADNAWKAYRESMVGEISERRQTEIDKGAIMEIKNSRHSGAQTPKKSPIIDESTAFKMAATYFFINGAKTSISWADIARAYPPPGGYSKSSRHKAREIEKRANQIGKRTRPILESLGLTKKPVK